MCDDERRKKGKFLNFSGAFSSEVFGGEISRCEPSLLPPLLLYYLPRGAPVSKRLTCHGDTTGIFSPLSLSTKREFMWLSTSVSLPYSAYFRSEQMWDDEGRRPKNKVFEYLFIAPHSFCRRRLWQFFSVFGKWQHLCLCFCSFFVSILVTPDNDALILPGRSRGKKVFFLRRSRNSQFLFHSWTSNKRGRREKAIKQVLQEKMGEERVCGKT